MPGELFAAPAVLTKPDLQTPIFIIKMSWIEDILYETSINETTTFIRLLLSLFCGGVIGWERENRRQPAGLRTHILICLGATLLMLISIYIPQTFKNFQNGDPGRIAAQVVSGIGFLGGGAIFRLGATIRGLTTAATIWTAAAIGLAIGAGAYVGAIMSTAFTLFVLIALERVENKFFPELTLKVLKMNFQGTKIAIDSVFTVLERYHIRNKSVNVQQSLDKKQVMLKLIIEIPGTTDIRKLYKDFKNLDNVTDISLGQDF
jgi:putative Mg2+ transporter-C (MgtC) family protein